MTTDLWRRKLLAFLHDPPHKPFRLARHEDARGPLLRHVELSEDEIAPWHHRADWWAAAADRFPFPRADVMQVDWQQDENLGFRHPLGDEILHPDSRPRPGSHVAEKWIEETMHGLPTDDAGWQAKFFRLWRLWPERCAREKSPFLAYLVADTRIPDHTLWQHNAMVSAIDTVGQNPAFLLFQIGPVQDFIAQARKMQDLWSGTYLLSFLIAKALATIALRFGPDCMIYPNLRGVPLLDWWWSRAQDLFPKDIFQAGKGRLHRNELLVPCLPNRFLGLVPGGEEGQKAAEKAEGAVRRLWRGIADAVHADICTKRQHRLSKDEFRGWDRHWQSQIERFPIVDWVMHRWTSEQDAIEWAAKGTLPLADGWEAHPLGHALAWRDMIAAAGHEESWHGRPNDAFAWAPHYAATDWKFAAAKNARPFAAWQGGSAPKDNLSGRDEVLGVGAVEAFWTALREAYGSADRGEFKGSQQYGAISVIKRLWPHVYLEEELGWDRWQPGLKSVQDIARAIDAEPDEPEEGGPIYYAVLCMDGADTGQRVSGARTPPLKGVLAGKAWDYFCQGKDGKGGWKPKGVADLPADAKEIRRPLSPSFHAALSEAIPMAAGQGRGRGCRLPFPSTVHEALRASLMLANGKLPDGKREPGRPQNAPRKGNWHATGVETDRWLASKAYRSLVTVGPFPCLGPKKCKEDPEPGLRFPVPPDVAFDPPLKSDKDASTPVHLRRLELWFDLDAVGPTADAGQPYRPLCLPVATTPLAQENPPRGWWTAQQYVEYLRGETRADKFHPTPESALWEAEHRVGVEIDPSSSAAAEGQLYAASFMRPRGNLRFALQADLIDRRNGEAEELDRLDWLLLGGERRLARVRHDTMAPVWSDLPRAPAVSGDAPCVLKWVLVTPAIFAHGSLPGWCAHPPGKPDGRPLGDVRLGQSERKREDGRLPGRAVLAGWCLGKPLAISGWDAAENLAKPTQLAVPAGSVYYFLCENGATATALAARLHWKPRSDMYGEKGCGYGFCRADASLHEAGGSIEQLRRLLFAGGNG